MTEMVCFKKAEIEDLVKDLDKFIQKLDVVAAVIFTLIDVKGELESKQQQPCYFCYDQFLDSGWSSCGGIISFLKTIVECYHMECTFSPIKFQQLRFIFEVHYLLALRSCIKSHQELQHIFSKTNSSSTHLKVLSKLVKGNQLCVSIHHIIH